MKKNEIVINLDIDESVILSRDQATGEELLKLGLQIKDKLVKFSFLPISDWDNFITGYFSILTRLAYNTQSVEIPDLFSDNVDLQPFYKRLADDLRPKRIRLLIEKVMFSYVKPKIDGFSYRKTKKFILKNITIDQSIKLFLILMAIEDIVKKNCILILQQKAPELLNQLSSQSFGKSGVSLQKKQEKEVSSTYINF